MGAVWTLLIEGQVPLGVKAPDSASEVAMTEIIAPDNNEDLSADVITLEGGKIEAIEADVVHINHQ